ncbi:MAG: dipeptidase [Desulfobacula sp.]|nr:dipeptidase [Desulfobacula sp.]
MKFFDLHCDTIQKIVEEDQDFTASGELHVNLPGIISSNTIAQVFACFILEANHQDNVFQACNTYIDAIETLTITHKDRFVPTTSYRHLVEAVESKGKTAAIIAIEGAIPLKGKPEMLEHFYNRGVRLLTIAWDDNEFCGTVFGNKGGLTKPGEELIRYCNELGVIVDVSHASDKAFYDIASMTKIPFMASHSNARQVCPNDRNLTDDMIHMIADRGGIIGLTYGSGFISPDYYKYEKVNRDKIIKGLKDRTITFQDARKISHKALSGLPDAPLSKLIEHIKHILNVGGEDCLGLGSDFDGVDSLPQNISGVQSLPVLVQEMQKQRISSRIIDKICYENAYRYFQDILK